MLPGSYCVKINWSFAQRKIKKYNLIIFQINIDM